MLPLSFDYFAIFRRHTLLLLIRCFRRRCAIAILCYYLRHAGAIYAFRAGATPTLMPCHVYAAYVDIAMLPYAILVDADTRRDE